MKREQVKSNDVDACIHCGLCTENCMFLKKYKKDIAGVKKPVALDRTDIYLPVLDKNLSIEAENLVWVSTPSGVVSYQIHDTMPWSGGTQLFWKDAEVGNQATFSFISNVEGKFSLAGLFTIARDYGVFDIYINGKKVFNKLDLNNKELAVKEFTADSVNIIKGVNLIEIELVKHAPEAAKRSNFGLDKLIFR